LGLDANVPLSSKIWKRMPTLSTVLVHSGNAALDDAMEEGFRLHWKATPWRWAADTGFPQVKADSAILVFGNFPMFRWREMGYMGCLDGWKPRGYACVQNDSASSFSLYLVEGKERHQEVMSEISELRSWPHGDAMAIDVVRDFNDAFQRIAKGPAPSARFFEDNREWPGLLVSFPQRELCSACTVWVAREYGRTLPTPPGGTRGFGENGSRVTQSDTIPLDPAAFAKVLGRPVQVIGMDSLEPMLGSGRQGLYLDAGTRSSFAQNLHLRTLDSGQLVATATRMGLYRTGGQTGLRPENLEPLAARLQGKELRTIFSASYWMQYNSSSISQLGVASLEYKRGLHGLVGIGNGTPTASIRTEEKALTVLLAGARWYPSLGFEDRALTNRVVVDGLLILPLGSMRNEDADNYAQDWNAPPTVQLVAAFNLYFLEMGFGFQIPLGEEYSHLEGYEFTGMAKSSNWVLRLALRTEWRGWKQAPKFD
jgi:hypothetical protein